MAKKETAAPETKKATNGKAKKGNGKEKKELKGLIAAAEELNELMDLDPPISTEGDEVTEEYLVKELKETASQLEAEDEITDTTRTTLTNIGATLPAPPVSKKEKKEKAKKEKAAAKPTDPNKPKKAAPRRHQEGDVLTSYGHRADTQAGQIDEVLKTGKYTYAEMAAELGFSRGRINNHMRHLERERGFTININPKTQKVSVTPPKK